MNRSRKSQIPRQSMRVLLGRSRVCKQMVGVPAGVVAVGLPDAAALGLAIAVGGAAAPGLPIARPAQGAAAHFVAADAVQAAET